MAEIEIGGAYWENVSDGYFNTASVGAIAVAGSDPNVIYPMGESCFYFGACAGGVWKTNDGGAYWENVSDGYFNTASVQTPTWQAWGSPASAGT